MKNDELDMTPADVLRAAADELALYGWVKDGSYGFYDGPKCMLGAVNHVASNGNRIAMAMGSAFCAAEALRHTLGRDPAPWNDHTARSRRDVIDLLLSTAADLEAKESTHAP